LSVVCRSFAGIPKVREARVERTKIDLKDIILSGEGCLEYMETKARQLRRYAVGRKESQT